MADSDVTPLIARTPAAGLPLGERLRSARKARALSVAQVAAALRLEESLVAELEEQRFDSLGAPVFVRGHLRRYAQLVGLKEELVLEAYRSLVPDSDALPSLARPRDQAEGLRVGPWAYWLAAAVVAAGITASLLSGDAEEPEVPAALPVAPVTPAANEAQGPAAQSPPVSANPAEVVPATDGQQ